MPSVLSSYIRELAHYLVAVTNCGAVYIDHAGEKACNIHTHTHARTHTHTQAFAFRTDIMYIRCSYP